MLDLRPMNEDEVSAYKAWIIEDFARDLTHYNRLPPDEALEYSARSINGSFAGDEIDPALRLYNIIVSTDGMEQRAGYLWIEVGADHKRCFIHDIYLFEAHRGQGWGRKTLERLEADMRREGVGRIALHVFAENRGARELYRKLGFDEIGVNMQKWLDT